MYKLKSVILCKTENKTGIKQSPNLMDCGQMCKLSIISEQDLLKY